VVYACAENGLQDLALYTDRHGEIALPRMHHASVKLGFSYGSRRR
jgi:hypothetical protein